MRPKNTCILMIVALAMGFVLISIGHACAAENLEWSMQGRDPENSFAHLSVGDIYSSDVTQETVVSSNNEIDNGLLAVDVNDDGTNDIIYSTSGSTIVCVSGRTKDVLFELNLDESMGLNPMCMDLDGNGFKELIIGLSSGQVVCYPIEDESPEKTWTFQADVQLGGFGRFIVIPEGPTESFVLFPDRTGKVYCLGTNGSLKWKTSISKDCPREIAAFKFLNEYKLLASTITSRYGGNLVESDITELSLTDGHVIRVFNLTVGEYRDYFYSPPSVLYRSEDSISIVLGGSNGYVLDYSSFDIESVVSSVGGATISVGVNSESFGTYGLFISSSGVVCWNLSSNQQAWIKICTDQVENSIVVLDIDGDSIQDVVIPMDDELRAFSVHNGKLTKRIRISTSMTSRLLMVNIASDVDGDGYLELICRARLENWSILLMDSPPIELTMIDSLIPRGGVIVPENKRRIGYNIQNIPSYRRSILGYLRVDRNGLLPVIEFNDNNLFVNSNPRATVITNLSLTYTGVKIEIEFDLEVNWTIDTEDFFSSEVEITFDSSRRKMATLDDAFRFENDLVFGEPLLVVDGAGTTIQSGEWCSPLTTLTLIGGPVVFEGTTFPPQFHRHTIRMSDGRSSVTIEDQWNGSFNTQINLTGYQEGQWNVSIEITDVPYNGSGKDPYHFSFSIDTTPPDVLFPDDDGIQWYTRRTVNIGIQLFDNQSGLDVESLRIIVRLNDSSELILDNMEINVFSQHHFGIVCSLHLQEGENSLSVDIADIVGNEASSAVFTIMIDTNRISFSNFRPDGWLNITHVEISVDISDSQGSGVNLSTIEYSYSTKGILAYSKWIGLGIEGESEMYTVSLELEMAEGTDNMIRFRASDVAGNEHRVSEDYTVRIDTTPPEIHMSDGFFINLETEIYMQVNDSLSGVDASTFSISAYSDGGVSKDIIMTQKEHGFQLSIEFVFTSYGSNVLKIIICDNAMNLNSSEFAIYINSPPELEIEHPINGSTYYPKSRIRFEALVTDPDGDVLEVIWSHPNGTVLNSSAVFFSHLPIGECIVTCSVSDGYGHHVNETITIFIEEEDGSEDGPWEIYGAGLILLLLIVLTFITVILYVRRKEYNRPPS